MKNPFCIQLKVYLINLLIVFLSENFASSFSKSFINVIFQKNNNNFFNITNSFNELVYKILFFVQNIFLFENNFLNQLIQDTISSNYLSFKNSKDFDLSSLIFSNQTYKLLDLHCIKNSINTKYENFELIHCLFLIKNNYKSFVLYQKYSTTNISGLIIISHFCYWN